ncbi:hypothetical protein BH09PSE3_BH09PSE3_15460 [soil metagenome]
MRFFLDTEFNGFGGKLISIALVPEDENAAPFYEAIVCHHPTPWVATNILPHLRIKPISLTEMTRRFAKYLVNDPEPLLVADWPEDIAHAALLLIVGPGAMCPVRSLRFDLVDPELISTGTVSVAHHNALSDAVALRANVMAYEARMSRLR